jgi:hypothetical protein
MGIRMGWRAGSARDEANDLDDGSTLTPQDRLGIDAIRRRLDAEFGEASSGEPEDSAAADRIGDVRPERNRRFAGVLAKHERHDVGDARRERGLPARRPWLPVGAALVLGCVLGAVGAGLYFTTARSPDAVDQSAEGAGGSEGVAAQPHKVTPPSATEATPRREVAPSVRPPVSPGTPGFREPSRAPSARTRDSAAATKDEGESPRATTPALPPRPRRSESRTPPLSSEIPPTFPRTVPPEAR